MPDFRRLAGSENAHGGQFHWGGGTSFLQTVLSAGPHSSRHYALDSTACQWWRELCHSGQSTHGTSVTGRANISRCAGPPGFYRRCCHDDIDCGRQCDRSGITARETIEPAHYNPQTGSVTSTDWRHLSSRPEPNRFMSSGGSRLSAVALTEIPVNGPLLRRRATAMRRASLSVAPR